MFLPSEEKELLLAACLLHHDEPSLLTGSGLERLLKETFQSSTPNIAVDGCFQVKVREILHAYRMPRSGATLEVRLGSILRLSDVLDQQMMEGVDVGDILDILRRGVRSGFWPEASIKALIQSISPPLFGPVESWRVPVFPQAALNMLRLMRDPEVNLADVVGAASLDAATSGLLMRLANSALFGSRTLVNTLAKAIGRIGFETSQRVITAAALGPMFSSPELQTAWKHSLAVADLSEQLAARCGTIDPAEAYLAGLLHDVGRIALLSLPLYDSARLQGLAQGGCPQLYAENLLLRTTHAELGARIVAGWRLPDRMIVAIRRHHRPEETETPLASLLYIAEYLSGAEEDLYSEVRLQSSLRVAKLKWGDIADYTTSPLGQWLAAA